MYEPDTDLSEESQIVQAMKAIETATNLPSPPIQPPVRKATPFTMSDGTIFSGEEFNVRFNRIIAQMTAHLDEVAANNLKTSVETIAEAGGVGNA